MVKIGKYLPLISAVLIGLLFQQLFIFWERKDTPPKAAMAFAQACFMLDEHTLTQRLCRQSVSSGMIDNYLYGTTLEAAQRGFAPRYVKSRIFHMQPYTLEQSDDTAKVRIVGKRRNSINPVYEYVGKLFSLTRVHDVEAVLTLVKENGKWKVCGDEIDLM